LKYRSDALNNIGYTFQQKGNNLSALDYYAKSLKVKEQIDDPVGQAAILNNIAFVYNEQGRIEDALEYYSKSLDIFERIKDKKNISTCLNNLASIYEHQGEITKAKEFYLRSSKAAEEIGDTYHVAVSMVNLAILYSKEGDLNKAIEMNLFCIDVFKKVNNPFALLSCYNNMGEFYGYKGDKTKARYYYMLAIGESERSGDKLGAAFALNNLAGLLFEMGKSDSAEVIATKALMLGKQIGSPEAIARSAGALYAVYKTKKDYRKGLEMYDLYMQMRDSVNNEATRRSAIRSQLKYEYEKKATADSVTYSKEAELKNVQIEKKNAEIKAKIYQKYVLFGGLGLVIVFAFFMYNRFKITQRQKLIIEAQKNEVEIQKNLVEIKQKEILDSINYARRIQLALITNEKYIQKNLDKLKN
jgi:tetratricopeptide (TPR) repeat protein